MNIKQKLTLTFSAIACLPVVLVAVMVILQLRHQAQEDFLDTSSREIRQIENAMNHFFEAISENVRYLAKLPQISEASGLKRYVTSDAGKTPLPAINQAVLDTFTRFAKDHPATAYLSLGQRDGGYAIWPDDPGLSNFDPRVRPWYQTAMNSPGQTIRTPVYYWAPDDVTLMAIARTVESSQDLPVGVLSLNVSLKQLTDLVKQIKLGERGYLMLLEGRDTVLVDPRNAAHNFKKLGELGDGYGELSKIDNGLTEVELDGVRYMANVWSSASLGWRFIGLIERDEVMARANSLTWQVGLFAAGMAVLFAMAGAGFAGLIARPIHGVASGLEGIAQGEGDLTGQLTVRGSDETALLARWFNQFLGSIRTLVQRIAAAAMALQTVSATTNQAAADMNLTAARQREAVELVSTAFNEMLATANEVARSCTQAASSADTGQRQVHDGHQQIDAATGSVATLSENLLASTRAMQVLEQDSKNINAILDTIRSIAEQTNLLALNAAIEAARAGEQGRGFAVVADEVRALAKRTADSTGEIDELLGGLAQRTQDVTRQMQSSLGMSRQSVERIQQARDSFELIRLSVDEIRDQNSQIATAAEQQHQVAEEINRHIAQIHGDAQRVEQLALSSRQDSERLQSLSGELNALIGRFKT